MKRDSIEFGSRRANRVDPTEVGSARLMQALTGSNAALWDFLNNAVTCTHTSKAHSKIGNKCCPPAGEIVAQIADWVREQGRAHNLWTTLIPH
jgi:hypothetical protein